MIGKCPGCGADKTSECDYSCGSMEHGGIWNDHIISYSLNCFRNQNRQLLEENKQLREELIEYLVEIMGSCGHLEFTGNYIGWYDTMALSYVQDAGDRLVELGLWERHPDGIGRRWWYKPKK